MGLFDRLSRLPGASASHDRLAALEEQGRAILQQVQDTNQQLAELTRRESQLRAVLTRDAELEASQARLQDVIGKTTTATHVARVVRRAQLRDDPFPHAIVDDVLPDDLYGCLIKGLPPVELFSDRPANKQHLAVPFALAPTYSQRVWAFMAGVVVPEYILPAVVEKFRPAVDAWIAANWPDVPPGDVAFHTSDGRLLLRTRGYRIPPHRDPKWGFITCILYLARRDDDESWGTELYSVDDDQEARGASPHWIDPARCRVVGQVEYRPNRMLVLLNSVGAHGAHIPDDPQLEGLQRYIYQFRIAPTTESMARLKSTLSEDRRPFWAGKSADY